MYKYALKIKKITIIIAQKTPKLIITQIKSLSFQLFDV